MTYSIVLSNNTTQFNIADATIDTSSTSLTLVGKNFAGYGQYMAANLVHMLENAANSTPPANPLVGQIWYNSSTSLLNVCTNNTPVTWTPLTTGVASVAGQTGAVSLAQLVTAGLAPLASPAFTGTPTAPTPSGTTANQVATVNYVTSQLDTIVSGVSSVVGATGAVSLTNLVSGGVAPLYSPAFSGIPTAPQPQVGDRSAQVATTQFVYDQVGALSTGVSSVLSYTGNVTLSQLTSGGVAPLASPTFTGVPAAPTAAANTNTTQIATTAFVTTAFSSLLTSNNTWTGTNTFNSVMTTTTGYVATGYDAQGAAQMRIIDPVSNYGVMFRNDGAGFYILGTAKGSPNATFNSYRPFIFNLDTGAVVLDNTGCGTSFGGAVSTLGPITAIGDISATQGHLRAAYGATGSSDVHVAATLADFGASMADSGYQKLPSGLIIQWHTALAPTQQTNVYNFPIAFPNAAFVTVGQIGYLITPTANTVSIGCQAISNTQFKVTVATNTYGADGCFFISIGY